MKTLIKHYEELNLSSLDCYYADVRFELQAGTILGFKNGKLEEFAPERSTGAFLRVYNNGFWFYKSTTDLKHIREELQNLIHQSQSFSGTCKGTFAPKADHTLLHFADRDPQKVSLADKRKMCESYLHIGADVTEVKERRFYYKDRYQLRAFKSTNGRAFVYDFADYGLRLQFTLREEQLFFQDSYNQWSTDFSKLSGYQGEGEAFLKESLRHLKAETIKPGKYSVVMSPEVAGVFTHESFGHKSEADFMLGDPAAQKEWSIGTKVAAECVSIVDYGGEADNSGYCPIDDEGILTQKTYLIKNGILKGRLHSLQTAHEFDEAPTGNARAKDFEFEPIVRMTNTYIEPGSLSRDEVLSKVKEGVFIESFRHGSGLSTFTIAPTRSYWIRNGKIAEPVRIAVISGTVFETLNKISAVSDNSIIHNSAFGGCGKDEQSPLRVADGGPIVLVDEMQVG